MKVRLNGFRSGDTSRVRRGSLKKIEGMEAETILRVNMIRMTKITTRATIKRMVKNLLRLNSKKRKKIN
jgi:hypothetical protein